MAVPFVTTYIRPNWRAYIIADTTMATHFQVPPGTILIMAKGEKTKLMSVRKMHKWLHTPSMTTKLGWTILEQLPMETAETYIKGGGFIPLPKSYVVKLETRVGQLY